MRTTYGFKLLIELLIIDFISADNFRPYLTSFQGNAFTDYINAVFVDVSMNISKSFNFQYFLFRDTRNLENISLLNGH